MVNSADPLAFYQIAENLRECIDARLALTSSGPPNRSCVHAGAIAWDDCECGQLIVSMQRQYFSDDFPSEAFGTSNPCGHPLMVMTYLVSMLRCAPIGEDQSPPACAELDAAARVAAEDAYAVRFGAWCCLREWEKSQDPELKIHRFGFSGQDFVGPDGMCQGSELTINVAIINACPPCDVGT